MALPYLDAAIDPALTDRVALAIHRATLQSREPNNPAGFAEIDSDWIDNVWIAAEAHERREARLQAQAAIRALADEPAVATVVNSVGSTAPGASVVQLGNHVGDIVL